MGGRGRDACRLDGAAWGLVRRERVGSTGAWQSPPWAACGAQPAGRGGPAGSGPRGGSSRAHCRGAAPGTGSCQTPRGQTRVSVSLARVFCVSPARHPGNPVWPLNGLRPSGGLAEASQALRSPRAQRPQAAPSDEEAGWARGLAGQTADPLSGHLLGGRGSCREVRAPALGAPVQPGPRRVLGCLLRATQHLLHPPRPIKNVPAVGGVKIEADTCGGGGRPRLLGRGPLLRPPLLFLYLVRGLGARPLPACTRPATQARPMGCRARSSVTITRGRAVGGQCLSRSCPQGAPARLSRPSCRSVEPWAAPGLGQPAACWQPGVPGRGHWVFQPLHSKDSISEMPGSRPGVSRVWDVSTPGSRTLNIGWGRSCFIPELWEDQEGGRRGPLEGPGGWSPGKTARES